MADTEHLLFGFSYHQMGQTNRWRSGGSTLGRVDAKEFGAGPRVRLAQQSEHIVWIDVLTEKTADQDIDELSQACEALANAEFRKLYPNAELPNAK